MPGRVVSLNLCTDQLLLALGDREQIASITHLAQDRTISFLAGQIAGLPLNSGKAESILFDGADLVLAGTYGQQLQVSLLRAQGLRVLTFGPWTSLEEGRGQIRALAESLGHPERGEALIRQIDAALEQGRDLVRPARSILAYHRMGWVPAVESPLGEVLGVMGFTPHQQALGIAQGGRVSLEALVARPPDFMLVDAESGHAVDNGSALFTHPALIEAVPMERRLALPGRLAMCGGPSTPALIEALVSEVRAKVR